MEALVRQKFIIYKLCPLSRTQWILPLLFLFTPIRAPEILQLRSIENSRLTAIAEARYVQLAQIESGCQTLFNKLSIDIQQAG